MIEAESIALARKLNAFAKARVKVQPISIRDNIGANVKRLREEYGLSVIQAAEQLGVGRQYWYLIEKGEANLTLEKLERVAEILDVSLPELLGQRTRERRG